MQHKTLNKGVLKMQDFERKAFAVARAGLSAIVDKLQKDGNPVILQKNNRDVAAIVPLELLAQKTKERRQEISMKKGETKNEIRNFRPTDWSGGARSGISTTE
jgi:antitoxin (DNA-binding transcriptional repressor) of toxin-antitoxin stability system